MNRIFWATVTTLILAAVTASGQSIPSNAAYCLYNGGWIPLHASLGIYLPAPPPAVALYGSNGSAWYPLACDVNGNLQAISLTTTGTSGAATLTGTVLNIPVYAPTTAQVQFAINGQAITPSTVNGTVYFGAGVNGAVCDDSTDDTAAFQSLVNKVYTAGGGVIQVVGKCLLNSASITFPNTGGGSPTQPAMRITGLASAANGQQGPLPNGPSVLDLRYNSGTVAKILTNGDGSLEIDHIVLMDGDTDCAPFFQTTFTTTHIHDMAFSGTHSGLSACNDAAYFGGPSQALFQGYGSTIDHVFFDKIREWAYLGYGANGLVIENNTSSTSGGNSSTDGSAIEANTTYGSGNTNTNNIIQNNTFEATFYEHFVKCNTCYRNSFLTNGAFDTGSTWLSTYLMSDGGLGYSFILEGLTASGVLVTGTDTNNTIISTGGNGFNSYFPNASVFEKGVSSVNGDGSHEWQITNQATSDSWWWQQTVPVNTQSYQLFDTPAGGAQINAMSVQHYGSDIYGIELNSTIESFFECPNGTCIVRSQGGSGQVQLNDGYVYVSSRVMNAPTFNATTAYKMNTNTILPSILNGYHGSGAGDVKTQLSDGTGISGHVAAFDATGGLTDGGSGGTVSSASLATTAAASNMVTIPGATSSSHCSLTPTNSGAALDLGAGTAYVSTKATNSITVTHAAVASETFDLMCTSN